MNAILVFLNSLIELAGIATQLYKRYEAMNIPASKKRKLAKQDAKRIREAFEEQDAKKLNDVYNNISESPDN